MWGNCLGMILVGIILIVGTFIALSYYTHHGENISVPNLRGMSQEAAAEKLEGLGLHLAVTDTGYVRTMPADFILGQDITPGCEVKVGRTIKVTINSDNSPTIALPDLADNCSLHEAKARLTAIGFRLGPVEYTTGEHDWVYAIKVKGRTVTAGQKIPVESPVTIVVGDGSVDEEFNGDDEMEEIIFGYGSDADTLSSSVEF